MSTVNSIILHMIVLISEKRNALLLLNVDVKINKNSRNNN